MPILGPTRLVLIRSGTFDFADVDLTRPLHLVGPNNVGKTTLVNLLQFLYVDSVNHMAFSGYTARETRRYYFPERHSYVLFECQTPEGLQVFGVHGTGPGSSYDVQRFAYRGAWAREDFLTPEGAPRPIDDVKPELAALKDLRLLEARHLRAALTGVGDGKGVHLGLVPVQSRDGYARFRELFKGLIRLRHLDQATLKTTLCATYAAELGATSVDLRTDYAEQFEDMQAQRDVVEKLERIEDDIREALALHEARQRLRAEAAGAWARLDQAATRVREALEAAEAEHAGRAREETEAQARVQKQARALDAERDALNQTLGGLRQERARLEAVVEAAAAGPGPDATEAELRRTQDQQAALRAQVQSTADDDPERVRARLERATEEARQARRRLAGLDDAVGPMLRARLGDERLRRLFRVLNPEMLDLSPGGPHLDLADPDALLARLRRLDDDLAAEPWTAPWGTLRLDGLTPPPLGRYLDPERVRADLRERTQEEERLRERLRIAENRSHLEAQIAALHDAIDDLRAAQQRHRAAQDAAAQLPALRDRQQATADEMQAVTARRDAVREEAQAHGACIREAKARLRQAQKARRDLDAERGALEAPPPAWRDLRGESDGGVEGGEDVEDGENLEREASAGSSETEGREAGDVEEAGDPLAALRPLFDAYRTARDGEARRDDRLARVLARIHRRTTARYERATPEATLDALRDELDALAKRRTAAEQMWQQLMTGLGRKLTNLLGSLDTLKAKVSAINRRLGGTSVSDLKRLRLVVAPVDATVRLLKRTAEHDAMPLFGDASDHAGDVKRLDTMLRTHPQIHLTDLFNVAFEVETVGGAVKRYDGLQAIESNGTSISIKVLVHLVLISDLLSDAERTLPFYLDEASSLDDRNLSGIVRAAQGMGFVPILASPTESTAVDHLYYLRATEDGGVYLGPEQRVRLQAAPEASETAAPSPAGRG